MNSFGHMEHASTLCSALSTADDVDEHVGQHCSCDDHCHDIQQLPASEISASFFFPFFLLVVPSFFPISSLAVHLPPFTHPFRLILFLFLAYLKVAHERPWVSRQDTLHLFISSVKIARVLRSYMPTRNASAVINSISLKTHKIERNVVRALSIVPTSNEILQYTPSLFQRPHISGWPHILIRPQSSLTVEINLTPNLVRQFGRNLTRWNEVYVNRLPPICKYF